MGYTALAAGLIVIAFIAFLVSAKILLRGSWLLGFIRGLIGVSFIVVAVLLAFAALDLYSYKQLLKEQSVANLSFSQQSPQVYKVSLVDEDGREQTYIVNGDLWQLDARILKRNKSLAGLGLSPGYRLDRLSGRYISLEEERSSERSVHDLSNSRSVLDMWAWFNQSGQMLELLDAQYGSATYLPMADGALFSVTLSGSGLLARPLSGCHKIT